MKFKISIETPDDYNGNYAKLMENIKQFLKSGFMKATIKQNDGLKCVCKVK